ncbi:MAG: hypothetical protein ACD_79C00900G0001, partial [uncultured bacterium]
MIYFTASYLYPNLFLTYLLLKILAINLFNIFNMIFTSAFYLDYILLYRLNLFFSPGINCLFTPLMNAMNIKYFLIFLFISLQTITSNLLANTYYVDNGASNANDDNAGTAIQPWKTIQNAANIAVAGDKIYVKKGIYHEAVTMKNSGKAGSEILFKNYNSDSVIVDAKQSVDYTIYWGKSNNYIIWDGIDVTGGGRGGLHVRGDYNIIQNIKAHDNNNMVDGEIMINSGEHNIVRNNEVYNGQNGIMIQDANHTTIEHNYVHDCPGHTGIDFLPITTRYEQLLWSDNNVRFNIIARCNRGIYSRYQQYNEYVNNLIYDNTISGIVFTIHPDGYPPPLYEGHTKVYNNTIVGNKTQGIDIVQTQYVTIKNNIIANNTKEGIRSDNNSNTGLDIDYNVYYDNGGGTYKGITSSNIGSHEKSGNPQFSDLSKYDFSI